MTRDELPSRRGGTNFDFVVGATKFTASVRIGRAGKIAEIFVNSSKIDSDTDLTMRDAAVVISVALQYGIEIDELRKSVGRNADGKASTPIGEILDLLSAMEGGQRV